MNELLIELARQAGLKFPSETSISPQEQKFAELIVKECLLAIDNTNTHHVHTTFDQGLVLSTIEKNKKAVKEHFGM